MGQHAPTHDPYDPAKKWPIWPTDPWPIDPLPALLYDAVTFELLIQKLQRQLGYDNFHTSLVNGRIGWYHAQLQHRLAQIFILTDLKGLVQDQGYFALSTCPRSHYNRRYSLVGLSLLIKTNRVATITLTLFDSVVTLTFDLSAVGM